MTKNHDDALTVGQLTRQIKQMLASKFATVAVRGEISGCKRAASGHVYFSLKDKTALINCVMWRSSVGRLRTPLEDGQDVIVTGKLDLYEPRGQYNLVVSTVTVQGVGLLQQKFEKLKKQLHAEGLFDDEHKKVMPFMPRCIGVITSSTGAAFHDIVSTVQRRMPKVHIVLHPARVQGAGAKEEIVAGVNYFNKHYGATMDLMIVGRGGGSLEDLWAFNEEVVARSIFASQIPVISAVGHEVDFSIADFVADIRAATPTAAAELAVPDLQDILYTLNRHKQSLAGNLRQAATLARSRVDAIRDGYAFRSVPDMVQACLQQVDDISTQLYQTILDRLRNSKESMAVAAARLQELSPLNVMARGYSVATLDGELVRQVDDVSTGDSIQTRLRDGVISSVVQSVEKNKDV